MNFQPIAVVKNIEVDSYFGPVGSLEVFNAWESRRSPDHAKRFVADIASLAYGLEEARNYQGLFDKLLREGHLSCLEFVPELRSQPMEGGPRIHLPEASLRTNKWLLNEPKGPWTWGDAFVSTMTKQDPCFVVKVTCPLYVRSQWMRHRAASYLEMSRRYTLGHSEGRVPFAFYGPHEDPECIAFWEMCLREYNRRLDAGRPAQRARGCIPMEAMTTFYAGMFYTEWKESFFRLRCDAHAQPEIRVMAEALASTLKVLEGLDAD
jgi:hypothetical protein